MTNPAWGLLQQNGPTNALMQGLQMGQGIKARREATEYRNALLDERMHQRAMQQEAAAEERRKNDMGTFRRLLERASEGPEGYAQALGAAQQMGLDVSGAPQQYDPNWVQQQRFIFDAMQDPGVQTSIQKDIASLGIDPNTPEGRARVNELILFKYAKPVTDQYGRAALSLPNIGATQGAPQPGAVEDGYRFLGGDPADPQNWQKVN